MKKKALITGIAGQDGSYLSEYLLSKNYEVYGLIRRNSIVDLQGDNRFDRAGNFFLSAQNLANQEDYIFNWNKFTVSNAAHDLTPIANFAINLLYQ